MSPRRAHKKSRTGCLQCKKRRVKCDESAQPCANCSFRGLDCTYPERPAPAPGTLRTSPASRTGSPAQLVLANEHSSPQSQSQSQPSPSPAPAPGHSTSAASTRLQLELMHTFCTSTYKSLFSEPTDNATWQVHIPRRALQDENASFLLDGLLSVAALHTAFCLSNSSCTPEDRARKQLYVDTAMEYQSRAFEPFQHAIQHISQENCDIVFAHSLITIVHGIAVPQVLNVSTDGYGHVHAEAKVNTNIRMNMLETIFTLFVLVHGSAEINRLTVPWLKDKDPCFVFEDFWGPSNATRLDAETETALNLLNGLNNHENNTTTTLPPQCHAEQRHAIIDAAISRLRRCFQRYRALHDPVSVLNWLATVDRGFVDCLHRRETLPLLVLLHWGVLLAMLDGSVWWAGGSGRGLARDVLGILGADEGGIDAASSGIMDLGEALAWPKAVLGV